MIKAGQGRTFIKRLTASGSQPALALDFLGLTSSGPSLDSRITFTRASTGTYFGRDGLLKTAGTNLMLSSRDFNAGVWSRSDCSAQRNQVAADGAANAATLITEGSTGLAALTQGVTVPSGAQATSSIDIKRGNTDWIRFTIYSSSGNLITWFNLATGTLGSTAFTAPATGAPVRTITPLGNGFYRITVSGAITGMTTYTTEIVSAPSDNGYARVNGAQYILDRAQIEIGSVFTTFAETTSAQTGAPRFDYDPATPAGVTGADLAGPIASPNYTPGPNTTLSNGIAYTPGLTNFASLFSRTGVNYTQGKTYFISVNATKSSGTSLAFQVGSQNVLLSVGSIVGTQNYAGYFTANNAGVLGAIEGNSGTWVGSVNSVTVQEVVFTPRGLLIEEPRTNLLTFSNDLSNAAWVKSNTSVSRTAVGLDGSVNTGNVVTATSGLSSSVYNNGGSALPNSTTYTRSIVAQAGTTPNIIMEFSDNGVTAFTRFNLTTNAIDGSATSGASIVDLGGGRKRCIRTFTTGATGPQNAHVTYIDTYGTASGNTNLTIYENQLELGAFATSIIPTTSAAVTRSVDTVSVTGTNLTSWLTGNTGTAVFEGSARFGSGGALWSLDVSTTGTLGSFIQNVANNAATFEATGGTAVNIAVNILNTFKSAYAFAPSDRAYAINGGAPSSNADGGLPASVDTLRFGINRTGTPVGSMYLRRFSFYNTRLPNAQLQALTV